MRPLLVRLMLSAMVGTVVFLAAVAVQFTLLGDVIPLRPPEHPMQDGIERIPWQVILPISLGFSAIATLGSWAFITRRQAKKLS